jgi:cytidine deaminase
MNAVEQALDAAIHAREFAHAPYSGFKVGAAIKVHGDPHVYVGCNVENASYGATICAERSAIMHMISVRGVGTIEFVLVATAVSPPSVPCALCLQVLAEFTSPDTPVHLADLQSVRRTVSMRDLLPEPFVLV